MPLSHRLLWKPALLPSDSSQWSLELVAMVMTTLSGCQTQSQTFSNKATAGGKRSDEEDIELDPAAVVTMDATFGKNSIISVLMLKNHSLGLWERSSLSG